VGTTVRRVILDKQVRVLDGASIGLDATRDADRFTVSPEGIVVVGKGDVVE
ncbi:MAG: glucose-1-phosphate adenylyltransferase, partial [Acidobacteriota bacterium]|nr:glucose-1-phosphate adenylyltransferase [Acidobacteriota bacterium]